jgi:two-component system sensor histidine kinase PfeS
MNHGLFWKLFTTLVAGTVVLFAGINWLVSHTEQRMSSISDVHQNELKQWADHAEALYLAKDTEALNHWVLKLQEQERTWVAVVSSELHLLAGNRMDADYTAYFRLGRSIEWMIHLYQDFNPVMDLIFNDGKTHFLIRLPQRMRPGDLWQTVQLTLQFALPFCVLAVVCLLLYGHLVSPIRKLEKTTRQFSAGNYSARVSRSLGSRNDELASLARTFDRMAEHTGGLIITQRQLIADLSHELRTPITRIEMALNSVGRASNEDIISRIKRDVACIKELSTDALTLAWMDTEKLDITNESIDLVDLLDSIIEDARFEFCDRTIVAKLPEFAPMQATCSRLLGQAIENVIRNGLRYTPIGGKVEIYLKQELGSYTISIQDQGPGIPEEYLQKIFEPFFRVEKARGKESGGFGLGLALAKRQILALSGSIAAKNRSERGAEMIIVLPK